VGVGDVTGDEHWVATVWLPAWLDATPSLAGHAAVLRALTRGDRVVGPVEVAAEAARAARLGAALACHRALVGQPESGVDRMAYAVARREVPVTVAEMVDEALEGVCLDGSAGASVRACAINASVAAVLRAAWRESVWWCEFVSVPDRLRGVAERSARTHVWSVLEPVAARLYAAGSAT
jgi:hypothetical protein